MVPWTQMQRMKMALGLAQGQACKNQNCIKMDLGLAQGRAWKIKNCIKMAWGPAQGRACDKSKGF